MLKHNNRMSRRRWAMLGGTLAVLTTVGVASLTGAAGAVKPSTTEDKDVGIEAVPGAWTLAYDWGCDGSYSTATFTFNADGTWNADDPLNPYTGRWALISGMLTFNFDTARTTYSGNIASKSVTGIQTTFAGLTGCFYMLQAGAPTTSNVRGDRADVTGKATSSQSIPNRTK